MLVLNQISCEAGGRPLLKGVSFAANPGKPVGLIGPNGAGKSTLLRIIAGQQQPDSGRVEMPPGSHIGFLRQGHVFAPGTTAVQCFPGAFGADDLEQRLTAVADAMARASGDELDALSAEYDTILERLGSSTSADSVRAELGVGHVPGEQDASLLSGGELTKLAIADLVSRQPSILLLDEPTNHLDITGIRWVEHWIRTFPGPCIIVSHDRALLDNCAAEIVAIDPRKARAETFAGGYSDYLAQMAHREAEQWAAYERQQKHEARLKSVIHDKEARSRGIENRTIDFAIRKKAAKIARRAVTLRARLEREIASAEHVERPAKAVQSFDGAFAMASGGSSSRLLWAEDLAIAAGDRVLASDLTFTVERGDRFVIAGPNGSGKTTLLRTVLGEIPAASGEFSLAGSARIGFLSQVDPTERELEVRTPVDILRAERSMSEAEANNELHHYLFAHEQLHTRLCDLSYGERRRFALARLVLTGANLLILDEPTNHLDLPSREAFETALAGFPGAAIVVSHDRYFIDRYATHVLELGEGVE